MSQTIILCINAQKYSEKTYMGIINHISDVNWIYPIYAAKINMQHVGGTSRKWFLRHNNSNSGSWAAA